MNNRDLMNLYRKLYAKTGDVKHLDLYKKYVDLAMCELASDR